MDLWPRPYFVESLDRIMFHAIIEPLFEYVVVAPKRHYSCLTPFPHMLRNLSQLRATEQAG